MADNINYNKERQSYSFYSLKERAWHGLGQVVQEAVTPDEAMRLANLDYEVALGNAYCQFFPLDTHHIRKKDGVFYAYDKNDNYIGQSPVKGGKIPKMFGVYRTDTKQVFGSVGNRYTPVQNSAALEFIYKVCQSGEVFKKEDLIIQTAGALGKGETIFVTAKLPKYEIGNDEVDRYILFTNNHDGKSKLTACFTNVRVVCNNTLNMALHSCTNKFAFRHTANIHDNLAEAASAMRLAVHYHEDQKQVLEFAQTFKVSQRQIYDYLYSLVLKKPEQVKHVISRGDIDKFSTGDDVVSTVLVNRIQEMQKHMENGIGQDVYRGTAYWMFNGITTYIQNGKSFKSNEDKFKSITNGTDALLTQSAYDNMQAIMSM